MIVHSGASSEAVAAPRAHSIHGIATSSAFFGNWSLSSVLEATSWRSNTVFTSFYFRDIQYIFEGVPLSLLESALVSLHLFLISSGGGGSAILVPFP